VRIRPRRARQGDVLGHEVAQPGPLRQRHHRDQTCRTDQVRLIETGPQPVRESHLPDALLTRPAEPSQVPSSQVSRAFGCHDPPKAPLDPGLVVRAPLRSCGAAPICAAA